MLWDILTLQDALILESAMLPPIRFAYFYGRLAKITVLALGIGFLLAPGIAFAEDKLVTFEDIRKISPKAKKEFIDAIIAAEPEFKDAGITTRLRMAHFLAQMMTETGGLNRIDENMHYSFKTLMRVFSRKTISEAKAREIAGKDKLIANWVYGARLGNLGRHTDDGWNYRGSGFMQLTGRANFRARGRELGLPLEDTPELARKPKEGLTAAIAYWKASKVNDAADNNDAKRVRILVNGPRAEGLEQSKVFFGQAWSRVFKAKASSGFEAGEELANNEVLDESAAFDRIMENSGLLSEGFETDTDPAAERAAALKLFQNELGLPETGELDEATKQELLDPREWRYADPDGAAPARPADDLDQTVAFKLEVPGSNEAGAIPVDSAEGTGVILENPGLPQEDAQAIDDAKGIYPDYEMGHIGADPNLFQPHSVIGEDTRAAVLDTTTYPSRAIVQILFETRSGEQHLCTGALISPDTVLTAGHCVHSGTLTGEPYQNFRVFPGRNLGAAPFGRCLGKNAFVLAGWTGSATPDESRYYDLGAIKLNCHVGDTTGWMGVRTIGDDEAIETVVQGYAADRTPTGRQWVSEDKLRLLWELKGFYQNDTFGGTSGAPVFAKGSNETIIGVHTNGLFGSDEPWKSNNAFTRITPERLALIQSWINN